MWWILRLIFKSRVFPLHMDPKAADGETTRRRPLHTCMASMLAAAHIVSTKVQGFDSPIGSTAKRIMSLINLAWPLIYAMQYHWLVSLAFIDDRILAVENVAEFIFPPSKFLFNKIDDLVYGAECLPEKLDGVFNSFPTLANRFPLLDYIMPRLVSWLTFLINGLSYWGLRDSTRVKEITIDVNSSKLDPADCHLIDYSLRDEVSKNERSEEVKQSSGTTDALEHRSKTVEDTRSVDEYSPCGYSFESAPSSPLSATSEDEAKGIGEKGKLDNMKCSYKEILEFDNMKHSYKEVLES